MSLAMLLVSFVISAGAALGSGAWAQAPAITVGGAVGTEAVALAGFGRGFRPAPAARVGVAVRRGPWWTAELVAWSHPDLHRALALPVGAAWRPAVGPVRLELGGGIGPMIVDVGSGVYVPDDGGWRERPGLRAALAVRVGAGLGVAVTDRITPYLGVDALAQVPWAVAGQPVLPHRLAHLGVRVAAGGAP